MQGKAVDTRLWRLARMISVAAALGVVSLLLLQPDIGLFVTWKLLVPVVPLLLLIAPEVWRNLCPIAVVHQVPARFNLGGEKRLSGRMQRAVPAVAGLLFVLIVPLRLIVFNDNGPALALFVVAVLAVALAGGLLFRGKSGWCVTLCPVLPVERLYGQRPVVPVEHAHCTTCSGCLRSCYDLKPERSLDELLDPAAQLHAIGRSSRSAQLLSTPTGWFAAGFPGFVLGYFLYPDSLAPIGTYAWLLGFALISGCAFAGAQYITRWSARTLAKWAAAIALCCYYWFTLPDVARSAHELLAIPAAPAIGVNAMRSALFTVAAVWLFAALRRDRNSVVVTGIRRRPRGS